MNHLPPAGACACGYSKICLNEFQSKGTLTAGPWQKKKRQTRSCATSEIPQTSSHHHASVFDPKCNYICMTAFSLKTLFLLTHSHGLSYIRRTSVALSSLSSHPGGNRGASVRSFSSFQTLFKSIFQMNLAEERVRQSHIQLTAWQHSDKTVVHKRPRGWTGKVHVIASQTHNHPPARWDLEATSFIFLAKKNPIFF